MRRTCRVPECLAGETHLFVLLVSFPGCSAVKNNKGWFVFREAAFQSQRATYGARREAGPPCSGEGEGVGGLWSVIRNWRSRLSTPLQPARLDQVYKKHMLALTAPLREQRALRDGLKPFTWKEKIKNTKLQRRQFWLQTQSAVLIFFFSTLTHSRCIKMVKQSLLCSITLWKSSV